MLRRGETCPPSDRRSLVPGQEERILAFTGPDWLEVLDKALQKHKIGTWKQTFVGEVRGTISLF